MPGRSPPPPPDDDPKFLARMQQIRKAPRSGEVVEPRHHEQDEDDEDHDGPLRQDLERFSGVTKKCPECGKEVFDDSAVCYHCGNAFERTTEGSSRPKMWVMVTVGVLIVVFSLALVLHFL